MLPEVPLGGRLPPVGRLELRVATACLLAMLDPAPLALQLGRQPSELVAVGVARGGPAARAQVGAKEVARLSARVGRRAASRLRMHAHLRERSDAWRLS